MQAGKPCWFSPRWTTPGCGKVRCRHGVRPAMKDNSGPLIFAPTTQRLLVQFCSSIKQLCWARAGIWFHIKVWSFVTFPPQPLQSAAPTHFFVLFCFWCREVARGWRGKSEEKCDSGQELMTSSLPSWYSPVVMCGGFSVTSTIYCLSNTVFT